MYRLATKHTEYHRAKKLKGGTGIKSRLQLETVDK